VTSPATQTKPTGWIIAAAAAAAAAVFLLDLFSPVGITVPMLYVLPILVTWFVPGERITVVIAGCSFILTMLGMVLSPGEMTSAAGVDRAIVSTLLLIVAALLNRQKGAVQQSVNANRALRENEERLQRLNETLETRVRERTAALAEANERWHWVVRATNDGVWDWDLRSDQLHYSPRWKEMHGFREEDRPESTEEWLARIHPEDRTGVLAALDRCRADKGSQFYEEYRIQKTDGTYFWVLDQGIAIFNDEGRAIRMIGAESDITWRKETEEALHRREYEFRTLADNVPALFAYVDRDQRYRFVNKRYEEHFNRSDEEITRMTMRELLGAEGYQAVQPYLEQALRGESVSFHYRLPAAGGGERWLAAQYVPDKDQHGLVTGMFVLQNDITEQKSSEERLRELSGRLLIVQEEERRRIARDLHDDVMQRMGALALDLYGLVAATSSHEVGLQSQLKACGASAEQLTTDLQRVAHQLHPSALEVMGLEVAVREHVNEFASRTGVTAEFVARDVPKDLPLEYATCLYRVMQEGLQNVQKHAGAHTVLVRLLGTGRGLGLCVHDDGHGFEELDVTARRKGLGLTSMAERVGMLRGTFRVKTKPGHGTELHVWVPLENVNGEA